MDAHRTEHDAFGPVSIPADRYWGAQTQRALALFDVSDERLPVALIRAFGLHKQAAARANMRCGALPPELGRRIEAAAQELHAGRFDAHFPLPVWQTGSGTQTNMNANEVIANRANELAGEPLGTRRPVHPNDHVNASQSSNDSFPTVMQLVAALELRDRLTPALERLQAALEERAAAFAGVLKIARTHLMDAVPTTLGRAFEGYAVQVRHGLARVRTPLPRLLQLPQGGTAAGTGLNAPEGFAAAFCEELSTLTGLAFVPHACKVEGMAAHDTLVELSAQLSVVAVSLTKIANDLRWMGSGPYSGLGEIRIPDDGLTSSIMPGKRNPTIAEALVQACMQVAGNHAVVTLAGASGSFELNVAKPVLIHNVLQSIRLLADGARLFATRFVAGIEPETERLAQQLSHPLLAVTALNPVLGYDGVARITREALERGITPREAAISLGLLSGPEFDRLVDPRRLAAAG